MGSELTEGIVIVGDAVVSSTVFPSDCLVKVVTNIVDCVIVLAIISVVFSTAGLGVVSPSNSLG
jgi:hypothetical protein